MRCLIEIGAHVGGVFPSEVIQKDEQYVGDGRRPSQRVWPLRKSRLRLDSEESMEMIS